MKELLLGGLSGLLLGIAQVRLQLHRRHRLQGAAAGGDAPLLRSLLLVLGTGLALSALMMWLAVIDVDTVSAPDLHAGTLIGGLVFGIALGISGMVPETATALLGAGPTWEGACAALGCVCGWLCLPLVQPLFQPVQRLMHLGAYTWFRVTLADIHLLPGGFLALGCLGLALVALALCIRCPEPTVTPPQPPPATSASADPEDVQQDAVVVTLPGEEPVVVDTAQEPPAAEEKEGKTPSKTVDKAEKS